MQFLIKARDGENVLEKRMAVRPRHLEGMAKLGEKVICGGGILDDDGIMKGSVIIAEFNSRAEVDDYLASEPYVLEGVWERVEVEPVNIVVINGEAVQK